MEKSIEKPMMFLSSMAVAIGLNEAIVLMELHRIAGDGDSVTCNAHHLREWFPFWDDGQIEGALKSLSEAGCVHLKFGGDPIELRITLHKGERP